MKFLLFIDECSPSDHDRLVSDFVASFDSLEDAIGHYEDSVSGWPYTDDCNYDGCKITKTEIKGSATMWVSEPYIQVVHKHGDIEYKKISKPQALIAKWSGKTLSIEWRN